EVLYLAGEAHRKVRGVKARDGSRPRLSCDQRFPRVFDAVAEWSHHAEPGDHDSASSRTHGPRLPRLVTSPARVTGTLLELNGIHPRSTIVAARVSPSS